MNSKRLYLGVDGGGTRCRARIVNESGEVLGESDGGGANTRLGMDHVFGDIIAAASLALKDADLSVSNLGDLHAGLGLAGLSVERERKLAQAHAHPFASVCFATDAYTACLGAHDGANGAILIVGTGTCGQAIIDDQELAVAGWGFEISDVGSGARIGRNAIEVALLAYEGLADQTNLTTETMAQFDHSPEKQVAFDETARPAYQGKSSQLVFDAEPSGDRM